MPDPVDDFNSDPEPGEANRNLPLTKHRPNETPNRKPHEQEVQYKETYPKVPRNQASQELSGRE